MFTVVDDKAAAVFINKSKIHFESKSQPYLLILEDALHLFKTFYSHIFVETMLYKTFKILIIMELGDNMMLLRKKKGLSQADLGKLIGTSGDVIGRYERGDITPSIEVVTNVAEALEASIDYLVGKTKIVMDKETVDRLEDIAKLPEEKKNYVFGIIDMCLRDLKAKRVYAHK